MRSEQGKSARPRRDEPKKRSGTSAPISLEDFMEKEVQSSTQDGAIHEFSVLADPSNEHSTKIKQKIRILDHPNNLIKVLWARISIKKGLTDNAITTGPNQYCFAKTFLDGEALRIFNFYLTELCQDTVSNLKISNNMIHYYF